MDIQHVCNAPSRQPAQGAELGIAIDLPWLRCVDALHGIIIPILPHKDAGLTAFERCRGNAGVLQRLPTDFQQQALLRI